MAFNSSIKVFLTRQLQLHQQLISKFYAIYTPDYLELLKPKYPVYPLLNVQIQGYDFPVLEQYQKLVHKIADYMEFDVEDSNAFPAQEMKISKYKPMSEIVDSEFKLNIYERNIQISNISGVRCPIFIRALEAALPEGVMLNIDEFNQEKDKKRYIPDKMLLDLKGELQELSNKRKN